MRLDYSLHPGGAVIQRGRAWDPTQLFARGQGGVLFSARRGLFLDSAGTEPAQAPGQSVAMMRDLSGNGNHAVQGSPSQRPILGRHPERGVVNTYPANTADLSSSSWASNRLSTTPTSHTTSGEPATVLTATQAHVSGAFMRGEIHSFTAGTYTLSAIARGTGWFVMRPTVESNFADAAGAWFNLGAGSVATVALASGASIFANPLASIVPVGTGYRVSITFTVTTAAPLTMRFYLVDGDSTLEVTPGAEVQLEAPQLENGTEVTPYQRRVSQYDIIEEDQRSLWYLSVDGVDDWMQLADPITVGETYIVGAVRDWHTGWPKPITFGSGSGASVLNLANGISLTADGAGNRATFGATTGWPVLSSGQNRADVVQVSSPSHAQAWRNGTVYPANPEVTGDLTQFEGFDSMFRAGDGYGLGRFYGGIVASGNLATSDLARLRRYLAKLGGVPA
ncbi:hypothetical protein [Salibaculum halophilum]|uniref:hypothetical protein n=1 Tax=Salibaculum halophilum TaxID=1914408 RepID=UPI00117AB262|nr:hypothetical protein [Salibaculum halophilum]